jgi:hypothetical protein
MLVGYGIKIQVWFDPACFLPNPAWLDIKNILRRVFILSILFPAIKTARFPQQRSITEAV